MALLCALSPPYSSTIYLTAGGTGRSLSLRACVIRGISQSKLGFCSQRNKDEDEDEDEDVDEEHESEDEHEDGRYR